MPCVDCLADPGTSPLAMRDVGAMTQAHNVDFYEDKLRDLAIKAERIGDELMSGDRTTNGDRAEPSTVAAKFYELAARCFGRGMDAAQRRESRAEIETLRKTFQEMRVAH